TKAGTVIFCLSVILWAMSYYPRLSEERVAQIQKDAAPPPPTASDGIPVQYSEGHEALQGAQPTWLPVRPPAEWFERNRQGNLARAAEEQKAKDEAAKQAQEDAEKAVKAAQSETSISGHIGHFIEPAIRPLGFDWKMGVGLVSAFAAREVFVSSMGIVYSVGE